MTNAADSAPVEPCIDVELPDSVETPVLVSVIIPAYNAADSISAALDSVFAQTFSDFEVLVINDGSPDTESLEQALQPYMGRIVYLKQSNKGPGAARNAGILQMRGKYAAFLDSDDVWLPTHLATQLRILAGDPTLDLVYADSILMEDGSAVGHAFGREPQLESVTFEALLAETCNVGTSSAVASRESLMAAGMFDERFKCCEDFDLWLRMSFRGARMKYDPAVHLYHNLSRGSLSGNRHVMKRARIEVYGKAASTLPVSEQQRSLIRGLVDKTEAACQVDLLKDFLHSRQYDRALATARRASRVQNNWKLRLTIIGLRTAPVIVRHYHRFHERILSLRSRIRRANSVRKLSSAQPAVVAGKGNKSL